MTTRIYIDRGALHGDGDEIQPHPDCPCHACRAAFDRPANTNQLALPLDPLPDLARLHRSELPGSP